MGSTSKRKTTAAKRDRERGLAERRIAKEARKDARRRAADSGQPLQGLSDMPAEAAFNGYGDLDPS
jgi:hypothetical protein